MPESEKKYGGIVRFFFNVGQTSTQQNDNTQQIITATAFYKNTAADKADMLMADVDKGVVTYGSLTGNNKTGESIQDQIEKLHNPKPEDTLPATFSVSSKEVAAAINDANLRIYADAAKNQYDDMVAFDELRKKAIAYSPGGFDPEETQKLVTMAKKIAKSVNLQK